MKGKHELVCNKNDPSDEKQNKSERHDLSYAIDLNAQRCGFCMKKEVKRPIASCAVDLKADAYCRKRGK
jgi:hypothetical protein